MFEGIITETTHFSDGKTTALEIKTPTIQTQLGNEAKCRIKMASNNGDLNNGEISLEVLLEENDDETHAYLKTFYKEHDLEPVISTQNLIIKK